MSITREYIEQLSNIEPHCFETDREEQWFNVGLKYGLGVADSNPKSPWISVNEKLPPEEEDGLSIKVLVASNKGNIHLSRYDYNMVGWISNVLDIIFTHWMFLPESPKE